MDAAELCASSESSVPAYPEQLHQLLAVVVNEVGGLVSVLVLGVHVGAQGEEIPERAEARNRVA